MNFSYNELNEILVKWPSKQIPLQANDSLMDRIFQILSDVQSKVSSLAGKHDLQPLIRHYLLRESYRAGKQVPLRVPLHAAWPSVVEWEKHGISTMVVGDQALITADPWHPTWLKREDHGVFSDAFTEKHVRRDEPCEADPFIADATGYDHYSCPGQREAVRATFLMKPSETLIVNLPTGSGKSLVGQAPALVHNEDGNLTIFVVPTVALALDQERKMREFFLKNRSVRENWPLAWHKGLSQEGRLEIRRRMSEGTQRILFTSPEALMTSLLRNVFEVVRAGMLRYFVIDEAHMVTQWGDEFRPEFQALAGLRNSLLRHSSNNGFRTLLLSGTFTEETVDTLATLFGPPDHVQMVSAVHLRPEPQYWTYHAASKHEKVEFVLEALRHAPRPFILYVTKRDDAQKWFRILQTQAGLTRIACFNGNTPDQQRESIIDHWVGNRLDGIVATSAFGVGIDKSDIRTVIHATIPETLDRFYQEVGRGGRDGLPSISLLVYDDTDWHLAKTLAMPAIITNELGISRWKALYNSRVERFDSNLIQININALRQGLHGENEYNLDWNMRTLLLMARAGLIALEVEANEDVDMTNEGAQRVANFSVRILKHGHQLPEVWDQFIVPSRTKTLQATANNLRLMKELLQGDKEFSVIFSELYSIRKIRWPVDVAKVCGGCPSDRFNFETQHGYQVPFAIPIARVEDVDFHPWKNFFPWLDPVWAQVFYDDTQSKTLQLLLKFLGWMVHDCGVQELAADHRSSLVKSSDWQKLYRRAKNGILIHRNLDQFYDEPYSPLARVTILDNTVTAQQIEKIRMLQRPYHILLLPKDTPEPYREHRRFADTAVNSAQLKELLAVIGQ